MTNQNLKIPEIEKPTLTVKWLNVAYQLVFVISVCLNVVLSLLQFRDREEQSKLQLQKQETENKQKELERRLFVSEHSPEVAAFRLTYELAVFEDFIRNRKDLPFVSGNKAYRILENDVYKKVQDDISLINRGGKTAARITFLIIANVHETTAANVIVSNNSARKYDFGDLEGHTAVMIPLLYANGSHQGAVGADDLSVLSYTVELGDSSEERKILIPAGGSSTWTPLPDVLSAGQRGRTQSRDPVPGVYRHRL